MQGLESWTLSIQKGDSGLLLVTNTPLNTRQELCDAPGSMRLPILLPRFFAEYAQPMTQSGIVISKQNVVRANTCRRLYIPLPSPRLESANSPVSRPLRVNGNEAFLGFRYFRRRHHFETCFVTLLQTQALLFGLGLDIIVSTIATRFSHFCQLKGHGYDIWACAVLTDVITTRYMKHRSIRSVC